MNAWTREEIIGLCVRIHTISPSCGCYVALTGGLLYREGPRKDADLLFYRIRQWEEIDMDALFSALATLGIEQKSGFGWCFKAMYQGKKMDLFFPEEQMGDYVPALQINQEGGQ